MQSIIVVNCNSRRRGSLRDAIASDARLKDFDLSVQRHMKPGRNPGWAKLHSTEGDIGAINLAWDGSTKSLTARVVTRGHRLPAAIIGLFVEYLLERHGKQIRGITVLP